MASAGMSAGVRRSGFRIVDALNVEWQQLASGDDRGIIAAWAARHDALAACRDLDQVLGAVSSNPDPALAALLLEHSQGAQLAGRVVLQTMLGKVVRMACRDPRATADDYVAAMWCRIADYPLGRRPARSAANLALDTLMAVVRDSRDDPRGQMHLYAPSDPAWELAQAAAVERDHLDHNAAAAAITAAHLVTVAERTGLIDSRATSLLRTVYVNGLPGRAAAELHSTTPGVIRVSCSRAVQKLAAHASVLLEAA